MQPFDRKIFFNYATVTPMSKQSYEAVKTYLDDFQTYGPPDVLYKYDPLVDDMAKEAATLIGCSPSEITSIKNTTEGIVIASEALPLAEGDEVLIPSNEYPANLLPWLKKRKDGVNVQIVTGEDSAKIFSNLLERISENTKAVSVSAAEYYDGFMPDLKALSDKCRETNTFLVVDAVQAVGIRKIDVSEVPVDILVCGSQKYLMAGPGSGFLYINQDIVQNLKDFKPGIRSMDHFDESAYYLKDNAGRFQDGTQNLSGVVALHAGLKFINQTGSESLIQKNIELLGKIKGILRKNNLQFIDHGDQQSNIVALKVADPQSLCNYLKEKNVYLKPVKDIARLSFIHSSRPEDVEYVAQLIREYLDSHLV